MALALSLSKGASSVSSVMEAEGPQSTLSSVLELQNSGGEPGACRVANEKNRAGTHRRRRRTERIVDPEISVRLERDTGRWRAELCEGRRRRANQRGEHALVGVEPDVVAAAEKQPPPADLDAPIGLDVRVESRDDPDLARRVDTTQE